MNGMTRRGPHDYGLFGGRYAARADDWAGDEPEALDMAMAAVARGVDAATVAAAFGDPAATLACAGARLDGQAPPPPTVGVRFADELEFALLAAYDQRHDRPERLHPRTIRPIGLRARLPGTAELAVAAAIALLLGTTALTDSLGLTPALAATPTTTVRETGTPLGPTGTAGHGTPAAMGTAEPLAMAGHGGYGSFGGYGPYGGYDAPYGLREDSATR
ncbi:MAG: hypothetical protein ABI780_03895 [Ardenticatenales bacterium]